MTRKTRRIIFYTAIIVFIPLSYITLLYAQGYKYDLNQRRFFRTGAFSLKANASAKVFIDDELIGQTSFLSHAYSQDRLLPRVYSVRVQQDGYSVWQKKVQIYEGQVSDFPHVLLLPEDENKILELYDEASGSLGGPAVKLNTFAKTKAKNTTSYAPAPPSDERFSLVNGALVDTNKKGDKTLIAKNVAGYSVSPSGQALLWWTSNELWVLWLESVDNEQPYHVTGERELITRLSIPIRRAAWFRGDWHIIVEAGGYRIVEIDKRGGINIMRI